MARKAIQAETDHTPIVDFSFEDRTYQIDPDRKKVYRRFVEIETSKAFVIISSWRSRLASV